MLALALLLYVRKHFSPKGEKSLVGRKQENFSHFKGEGEKKFLTERKL